MKTSTEQIDKIIDGILRAEGGYVDDPKDRGGATKYGISLRYIKGIGLDIDGNGVIDKRDVQKVTYEKARSLYRRDFYTTPRINRLPAILQPFVMDFAVHSGPPRAIIELQNAIAYFPDFKDVVADGVIGPRTIASCEMVVKMYPMFMVYFYASRRITFLRGIVQRNPSQEKYIKTKAGKPGGWLRRIADLLIEVQDFKEAYTSPSWATSLRLTHEAENLLDEI